MQTRLTLAPLVALVALFVLGNVGVAVSAAYGFAPPAGFLLLYHFGVAWAFAWWVVADRRARGIGTSIDHGWFVLYTWPVSVPWHVLATRGLRGCGLLLGIAGAFVGAVVAAWIVYAALCALRAL
ncbi:MAG TPA: hypothetical protein VEU30_12150 [Thermoanaerobaculia bacterium]|nr:hypothetical protein [Thermoanaerobaculia bacterium]